MPAAIPARQAAASWIAPARQALKAIPDSTRLVASEAAKSARIASTQDGISPLKPRP